MHVKWKQDHAGIILTHALTPCPICNDTYHTKGALRTHLNREHTLVELEEFLSTHEK